MSKQTEMKYREFGSTGIKVSAIGVGGWHLGLKHVDERLAVKLVRSAIDRGMTFMDNCWDYNEGASETRMGKALSDGYRDKVFLMTKIDGRTKKEATRQLDESILAQVIGTWFREAGIIVRRNGCTGDKYIGDAVMAVWTHSAGGPKAAEIHGILQALSEIQVLTSSLHQQFPLPAPIRIGAGINTGLSMMGNTGGQDSPDFSPLGDNVNAAFRLETATKKSGLDIALGRMTFECLGKDPEAQQCFEKRAVELKGYEQAVEAWLTSFTRLDEFLRSRVQG